MSRRSRAAATDMKKPRIGDTDPGLLGCGASRD
jgi:hypothetical protein